jgi:hypothetical protein
VDNKSKVKGRKTKAAPRDKPTKPLRSGDSPRFRRCGLLNLLLNLGIVGLIWATILAIPSLAWRVQMTAQMRAGDDALDSTFRIENAGPFTLYRVNYGCVYEMVKGDFGTLQNRLSRAALLLGRSELNCSRQIGLISRVPVLASRCRNLATPNLRAWTWCLRSHQNSGPTASSNALISIPFPIQVDNWSGEALPLMPVES